METKNSVVMEERKSTNILMGLVVALASMFFFFELSSRDEIPQEAFDDDDTIYYPEEEDLMPITEQEEIPAYTPPVVNVTPEEIQIVEDDVDLEEEDKIETTEENNQIVSHSTGEGPATPVVAQVQGPVHVEVEDNEIHETVDHQAEFPGGEQACYEWLGKNLKYPSRCQSEGIQGRVIVKFVVEKDGSINNVTVQRSPDDDLSKEAIRVVKAMPKWKPARMGVRPVRSYFTLPVMFRLN